MLFYVIQVTYLFLLLNIKSVCMSARKKNIITQIVYIHWYCHIRTPQGTTYKKQVFDKGTIAYASNCTCTHVENPRLRTQTPECYLYLADWLLLVIIPFMKRRDFEMARILRYCISPLCFYTFKNMKKTWI